MGTERKKEIPPNLILDLQTLMSEIGNRVIKKTNMVPKEFADICAKAIEEVAKKQGLGVTVDSVHIQ